MLTLFCVPNDMKKRKKRQKWLETPFECTINETKDMFKKLERLGCSLIKKNHKLSSYFRREKGSISSALLEIVLRP